MRSVPSKSPPQVCILAVGRCGGGSGEGRVGPETVLTCSNELLDRRLVSTGAEENAALPSPHWEQPGKEMTCRHSNLYSNS